MKEYRLALTTVPDEETGRRIARTLVEERLAACVNVGPALTSFYWWNGKIVEDGERLLFIKTKASVLDRLAARLKERRNPRPGPGVHLPAHRFGLSGIPGVAGVRDQGLVVRYR